MQFESLISIAAPTEFGCTKEEVRASRQLNGGSVSLQEHGCDERREGVIFPYHICIGKIMLLVIAHVGGPLLECSHDYVLPLHWKLRRK